MTAPTSRLAGSTQAILFLVALVLPLKANAQAIVGGFESNTLPPNDDRSTASVGLGFGINFFGSDYTRTFVNNNGNLTFDSQLGTFTPFELEASNRVIIAPFFADVDTGRAGNPVTYGTGSFGGRDAFGVNYLNVDYFGSSDSATNRNSFQALVVNRSDVGEGDFDIVFNYGQIEWEAGRASGGDANGLGGNSARVGFSNGTGLPGTSFELPGSAINGAFLDDGFASLVANRSNSNVDGRYVYNIRGGFVEPPVTAVPEPTLVALMGIGFAGISASGLAKRRKAAKV